MSTKYQVEQIMFKALDKGRSVAFKKLKKFCDKQCWKYGEAMGMPFFSTKNFHKDKNCITSDNLINYTEYVIDPYHIKCPKRITKQIEEFSDLYVMLDSSLLPDTDSVDGDYYVPVGWNDCDKKL